ncbi:MAG: hypothetical protein ABEH88_00530 [Halobacteriales archaeon]
MALDIGQALRDGFDGVSARNGLVLATVFVAFGLVNTTIRHSLTRVSTGSVLDDFSENPPPLEDTDLTTEEYQNLIADFRESVTEATPLAYLDSLSVSELILAALVLVVVGEAIRIVAIRTFVSPETGSISGDLVTRNLPLAVLNSVVGLIVAGLLIVVGLVFLLIPGVFIAVSLLFVRQEISVEDKNVIEALSGSWSLASGNRIRLFALLVVLVLIAQIVSLAIGLFGSSAPVALLNAVVASVILAYTVAVVSEAYNQLRTERVVAARGTMENEKTDEFADIDDELLP